MVILFLKSCEIDIQKIENTIKESIIEHFGFEVSVLVKTRGELQRIFDTFPFSEENKKASYFIMLRERPDQESIKLASEKVYDHDDYKNNR